MLVKVGFDDLSFAGQVPPCREVQLTAVNHLVVHDTMIYDRFCAKGARRMASVTTNLSLLHLLLVTNRLRLRLVKSTFSLLILFVHCFNVSLS